MWGKGEHGAGKPRHYYTLWRGQAAPCEGRAMSTMQTLCLACGFEEFAK